MINTTNILTADGEGIDGQEAALDFLPTFFFNK